MSTQAEKDVLQKIVEGMDISDEELEYHDAGEVKTEVIGGKILLCFYRLV